jgi:peptidoglycan/LPS O-acetylase OafA/YrhL
MYLFSDFIKNFKSKNGEYFFLQILRGVAATWVCFYHFTAFPAERNNLFYSIAGQGRLGVFIFFIISGYVIAFSAEKNINAPRKFAQNRFLRIYPPYVAAFTLILFLNLVSIGFTKKTLFELTNMTGVDYAGNILLISNLFPTPVYLNGIFWTLCFEMQFYILVYLSISLFRTRYKTIFIVIAVLHLLILSVDINTFYLNYSVYFFIGFTIYRLHYHDKKIISLALLFYFVIFSFIAFFKSGNPEFITGAITALAILLVRPIDKVFEQKAFAILTIIGGISYSLYLIHDTIGTRFIHILSQRTQLNSNNLILFSFIGYAIVLVCAFLFSILFEQLATDYLKRKTDFRKNDVVA